MEEKKSKFSIAVVLLIFAIIAIVVMSVFIWKLYNDKKQRENTITILHEEVDAMIKGQKEQATEIYDLTEQIENLNKEKEEIETLSNSTKIEAKEEWIGDIRKINFSNMKDEDVQYEDLGWLENNLIKFRVSEGKVSISIKKIESGGILGEESSDSLGFKDYSDYDGFSAMVELNGISDVKRAYMGTFGQDVWYASPILFLMNDGTIKYDTFVNVVKNKLDLKICDDLKEIVSLFSASEGGLTKYADGTVKREGGQLTTIAVDKYGYAYDLDEHINN